MEDYDTRHVITACLLIYTTSCAFLSTFMIIGFETIVPFTKSDYLFAASYLPLPFASEFILILFNFWLDIFGTRNIVLNCLLAGLFVIGAHRQNPTIGKFRVPLVPFIPALSIFFNVALIMHLSSMTWLRFFVWMTVGKLITIMYYSCIIHTYYSYVYK